MEYYSSNILCKGIVTTYRKHPWCSWATTTKNLNANLSRTIPIQYCAQSPCRTASSVTWPSTEDSNSSPLNCRTGAKLLQFSVSAMRNLIGSLLSRGTRRIRGILRSMLSSRNKMIAAFCTLLSSMMMLCISIKKIDSIPTFMKILFDLLHRNFTKNYRTKPSKEFKEINKWGLGMIGLVFNFRQANQLIIFIMEMRKGKILLH